VECFQKPSPAPSHLKYNGEFEISLCFVNVPCPEERMSLRHF
jgi:hypothetical protein